MYACRFEDRLAMFGYGRVTTQTNAGDGIDATAAMPGLSTPTFADTDAEIERCYLRDFSCGCHPRISAGPAVAVTAVCRRLIGASDQPAVTVAGKPVIVVIAVVKGQRGGSTTEVLRLATHDRAPYSPPKHYKTETTLATAVINNDEARRRQSRPLIP